MVGKLATYNGHMAASPLTESEVRAALGELPDWSIVDGKLTRELKFADFVSAFAFMTAIALHAEKLDHHPDWTNSYNRLTIALISHDVGGISARDLKLAKIINSAAVAFKG